MFSASERYLEFLHTTVFHRIMDSLLQNAEKAKGDFTGKIFRNTLAAKVNLDVIPLGDLSAKT
jgi:hypothetical protein